MNPAEQSLWKSQVLDEVFIALAASETLVEALVFKGARVLSSRLGAGRQSLDLDSNLSAHFAETHPDRKQLSEQLGQAIGHSLRKHFERQEPVRYELTSVQVRTSNHPMGWDAFEVKIKVNDLTRVNRSLPIIEIDIASPEELLETSVADIAVGGYVARAYTLERIAGEKLRAFLSSLPTYRAKMKKPGTAVRAKDLYDISRIHRQHNLSHVAFWQLVAKEFHVACRSRYIDCQGLTSFQEGWDVTRKTYSEATIPKDIPFEEAEATLTDVVGFLETSVPLPIVFPLPTGLPTQ